MNEADRREQLRAAVAAAKGERWEEVVQPAAELPPQPALEARDQESVQRSEDYGQGKLIHEDWLSKEQVEKLAINLAVAGAETITKAIHAEQLDQLITGLYQAIDRSTPGGVDDIPLIARKARMRIRELKEVSEDTQKRIKGQMQERRYPSQCKEQNLPGRRAEPVTRMCSLDHGVPATRIIGQIELEGHETMRDVAVCDGHGQALYDHKLDKFRDAGGTKEQVEKFEPYVKDTNTKLLHSRRPERPRERHEIERSLGLERERSSEGRTF